jgi:protein-disulfide isomerase
MLEYLRKTHSVRDVVVSGGDIAKAYGDVSLTPTTYVIDKEGKIIKRYVGEPDFAAMHILLGKALAAG